MAMRAVCVQPGGALPFFPDYVKLAVLRLNRLGVALLVSPFQGASTA